VNRRNITVNKRLIKGAVFTFGVILITLVYLILVDRNTSDIFNVRIEKGKHYLPNVKFLTFSNTFNRPIKFIFPPELYYYASNTWWTLPKPKEFVEMLSVGQEKTIDFETPTYAVSQKIPVYVVAENTLFMKKLNRLAISVLPPSLLGKYHSQYRMDMIVISNEVLRVEILY
jgi:hypothetical protein